MSSLERIKAIQARLGVDDNGIIGPATLTAIERLIDRQEGTVTRQTRLTCSSSALDWIEQFEISSEAYNNRNLKRPCWPGGASGVTIGIGHNLGYCSAAQFRRDWRGKIPDVDVAT